MIPVNSRILVKKSNYWVKETELKRNSKRIGIFGRKLVNTTTSYSIILMKSEESRKR